METVARNEFICGPTIKRSCLLNLKTVSTFSTQIYLNCSCQESWFVFCQYSYIWFWNLQNAVPFQWVNWREFSGYKKQYSGFLLTLYFDFEIYSWKSHNEDVVYVWKLSWWGKCIGFIIFCHFSWWPGVSIMTNE